MRHPRPIARPLFALMLLSGALAAPLYAQQTRGTNEPVRAAYADEHNVVTALVTTLVDVIQAAATQGDDAAISERLKAMAQRLHASPALAPGLATPPVQLKTYSADDLDALTDLLADVQEDLRDLRRDLAESGDADAAERVRFIERDVREARHLAEDLADTDDRRDRGSVGRSDRGDDRDDRHDDDEDDWREEWRQAREEIREGIREAREEARRDREDDGHRRDRDDDRRRPSPFDDHSDTDSFFGDYPDRWPFRETALYRAIPAWRYNRVEGLVLGIGLRPLDFSDWERAKLVGQVGYAFALDEWRYEAGAEIRLTDRRVRDYGLKVGGAYRRNTATNDLWKSNWVENSLAAFFFENDFFDYYQVEGYTLYAVQRLTPLAQVSAGYRSEDYRSLRVNTGYSFFGDNENDFRFNPGIDAGRMQSLVFAAEGGRVRGLESVPRGFAARAELEVGDGLGGDFAFTRLWGDARAYLPIGTHSSLGLRLRAGLVEGDAVPFQKEFSIGGIGTVRGYPQNFFYGERMLLANAEYIIGDVDFVDDFLSGVQVFGFFDAAWVDALNPTDDGFQADDALTSVGFGLGLDDRALRLELAFPLRDLGTNRSPSLWLRLNPTF